MISGFIRESGGLVCCGILFGALMSGAAEAHMFIYRPEALEHKKSPSRVGGGRAICQAPATKSFGNFFPVDSTPGASEERLSQNIFFCYAELA
jgi:hypothetical protein